MRRIEGEAEEISPHGGADQVAWLWRLANDEIGDERRVVVKISGTAMLAEDVHPRLALARESKGESEIVNLLAWQEPPVELVFHSKSTKPARLGGRAGGDLGDLLDLSDWFEERGVMVVFTARTGFSAGGAEISRRLSMNLIDLDADQLIYRTEHVARAEAVAERADAIRDARLWWAEEREGQASREMVLQTIPAAAAAVRGEELDPELPAADRIDNVKRQGRVITWTGPSTTDAGDKGWMIEVYGDAPDLLDLAIGDDPQDVLLTVIETLLPTEHDEPEAA